MSCSFKKKEQLNGNILINEVPLLSNDRYQLDLMIFVGNHNYTTDTTLTLQSKDKTKTAVIVRGIKDLSDNTIAAGDIKANVIQRFIVNINSKGTNTCYLITAKTELNNFANNIPNTFKNNLFGGQVPAETNAATNNLSNVTGVEGTGLQHVAKKDLSNVTGIGGTSVVANRDLTNVTPYPPLDWVCQRYVVKENDSKAIRNAYGVGAILEKTIRGKITITGRNTLTMGADGQHSKLEINTSQAVGNDLVFAINRGDMQWSIQATPIAFASLISNHPRIPYIYVPKYQPDPSTLYRIVVIHEKDDEDRAGGVEELSYTLTGWPKD